MIRFLSCVALLVCAVAALAQDPGGGVVPAARHASNVAVITINGPIESGTMSQSSPTLLSVHRRLLLAQRAGADAVVIELNTPGGDLWASMGIADELKTCQIKNTVAWVHPNAYSGGAIVAFGCREIVVSDPSTLGDAIVIRIDPTTNALVPLPESERQKLTVPLLANLVDSARHNHYDELLVQGIATRGVELWMVENKESGERLFINRAEYKLLFEKDPPPETPSITFAPPEPEAAPAAPSESQESPAPKKGKGRRGNRTTPSYSPPNPEQPSNRPVLNEADRGKWVVLEYVSNGAGPLLFKTDQMLRYGLASAVVQNDEDLKKFFGARNIMRLNQSWSEGLVAWLTWMPVRGLLVFVFLLALFVEMTHPGVMLPGAIAFVALVGLVAPPLLINLAAWWTLAAISVGLLLLALEVFVIPGFGVAGVAGLLLLFAGLLGTLLPTGTFFPDSPQHKNDLLYGVVTLFLAMTTAGVGMYFVARNFKSLPLLSRLVLKDPVFESDHGDELLAAMGAMAAPVRKGMTGLALTPLRPAGRVELDGKGRIIDVVSDIGYVAAGSQVRIVSVSEFRIAVEPVPAPAPPGDAKA